MINQQYKSSYVVDMELGEKCQVPGCDNPKTVYAGPGQNCCDKHRLQLKEHGGTARSDRPYTFDKEMVCSRCGYDPIVDNPYVVELIKDNADHKAIRIAVSGCIDVDHIDGNHRNNSPENLQSLCKNCHSAKTIVNGDNLNRYEK